MNNKNKSIFTKLLICAILAFGTTAVYAAKQVCKSKTYCVPGGCSVVTICYDIPDL